MNNYIAPTGNYKLQIVSKSNNKIVLQKKSENKNELLQIMENYGLKFYKRYLSGKDIFVYES